MPWEKLVELSLKQGEFSTFDRQGDVWSVATSGMEVSMELLRIGDVARSGCVAVGVMLCHAGGGGVMFVLLCHVLLYCWPLTPLYSASTMDESCVSLAARRSGRHSLRQLCTTVSVPVRLPCDTDCE